MEHKVYNNKREKIIDFLIGFFLIPAILGITASTVGHQTFSPFHPVYTTGELLQAIYSSWPVLLGELGVCVYISIRLKRKFIIRGLLYALVGVPLVLFGTCLLMFVPFFRK